MIYRIMLNVEFYQDYNYTHMCMYVGIQKYDCEGRLITAEYDNFYFLTSCEQLMLPVVRDLATYSIIASICDIPLC